MQVFDERADQHQREQAHERRGDDAGTNAGIHLSSLGGPPRELGAGPDPAAAHRPVNAQCPRGTYTGGRPTPTGASDSNSVISLTSQRGVRKACIRST
jgi:hypothetical protein